jgi:hypothetical protein
MSHRKTIQSILVLLAAVLFILAAGACATPAEPAEENDHAGESEAGDDPARVPNNGAVIEIISPEEGATFTAGEDIVVEVEVTDFTLNEDGSHWHVYVDGESYAMVVGETTTQVIRILDPGEHTITAYLANGDHEDLEDGGEVTITITE